MTKADWDAVVKTNLDSVFNVTKQIYDSMIDVGGPHCQRVFCQRVKGRFRPNQLRRSESRHARIHKVARA